MARGISLHVGVNKTSREHYDDWEGPLKYCEADADSINEIAKTQGFEARLLKTEKATRDSVTAGIRGAATELRDGDMFLVSYAGHGGQVLDTNEDEEDMADETWCLHDGQLLDDELDLLWAEFQPGVRILVLSDSCHSGTVTRDHKDESLIAGMDPAEARRLYGTETPSFRYMPRDVAEKVYGKNSKFYNGVQSQMPSVKPPVLASVLLISGCKDEQLSGEGWGHGLFTAALLKAWNSGQFDGGYEDFHGRILERMPARQQSALFPTGVRTAWRTIRVERKGSPSGPDAFPIPASR